MLLAEEAVSATIKLARMAYIAIMGIGAANDQSILIRAGCQTTEEVRQLHAAGAVGEILGNYFDKDGNKVMAGLDSRVISLSLSELHAVPQVIAVASEPEKAMALLGALRTHAINTLVTNCELAICVLRLAGVQDLVEEHELFEEI
jgi:DNA-binding transcriptional regulator LsrR (DeoR family)